MNGHICLNHCSDTDQNFMAVTEGISPLSSHWGQLCPLKFSRHGSNNSELYEGLLYVRTIS